MAAHYHPAHFHSYPDRVDYMGTATAGKYTALGVADAVAPPGFVGPIAFGDAELAQNHDLDE